MRKWFCIFFVLLLPLAGCMKKEPMEHPVRFFYRTAKLEHFDSTGVIDSEMREAGKHIDDTQYLLNLYLQGPNATDFVRTFPQGTYIKSLEMKKNRASIVLSDNFAQLTGLELSVACSCLMLTVFELTGLQYLEISAENALLDGNATVKMDYEQVVLEDLCRAPVDPN